MILTEFVDYKLVVKRRITLGRTVHRAPNEAELNRVCCWH